VSPDGTVFIDSQSTLDQPAQCLLRSTEDGHVVAPLGVADTAALQARGLEAPRAFVAKAADGTTDLYGVLYVPPGFDSAAAASVPLVDVMYGGPQVIIAPHIHSEAFQTGFFGRCALGLRELGFAVLMVDGRGTPFRGRAFHDIGYTPAFADTAVDDHAAVIAQLLDRHPALNGQRVGVTGHSFGGHCSTRAMLRRPDLFKVAVSSAGVHSGESIYPLAGFLPPPVYADGSAVRPTPQSRAENWRGFDNIALADRLQGHLLLVWGDADENAPPASTVQLINAFIKADKRVDQLYLPNRMHGFVHERYFARRMWDYFVEHLMGVAPPSDPRHG
jgi:dipeptidyl aminopeptidase/acylaminoacyl peptidase